MAPRIGPRTAAAALGQGRALATPRRSHGNGSGPVLPTPHSLLPFPPIAGAFAGNGATAANSQLVEVLQQVATGVLTADDAAMQLSQVVGQVGGVLQRAVMWGPL